MKYLLILLFVLQLQATEIKDETNVLDGRDITYTYTSNRSYHVKFEKEGLSYQYLTGSAPTKWWGAFPYTAYEVYKNVFMVSWYEKGYGDHVTLLIDFNTNILYGSALIVTKDKNIIHFHGAYLKKKEKKRNSFSLFKINEEPNYTPYSFPTKSQSTFYRKRA